jgi:KaiC/GvpD/RAD55 family RecA-like ATPase
MIIKKNKKLDLQPPSFNCDGNLAPHLKEYDMLQHLNNFGFLGVIGKPGSGKTSIVISMLTSRKKNRVFRKVFDDVILVMPTCSRESLKKNVFKNHLQEKMFDELTLGSITNIYNQLFANSENNQTSLLILDDVGASLKDATIATILRKIMFNRRHLKVHIIMLLQNFLSLNKQIRALFSNIIIFKPSKTEFENLMTEMFKMHKDTALDLMKEIYPDPHDYLFLNVDSQKMYKNFDEIILPEK